MDSLRKRRSSANQNAQEESKSPVDPRTSSQNSFKSPGSMQMPAFPSDNAQDPWSCPQVDSSQYKTANEYAQAVQQWLWQYHMWNQMNWFYMTFPFYAMSCMPQHQAPVTHGGGAQFPVTPAPPQWPGAVPGRVPGARQHGQQQAAQDQARNAQRPHSGLPKQPSGHS